MTSQEILAMVIGNQPNPNGYTLFDALKAAQASPQQPAASAPINMQIKDLKDYGGVNYSGGLVPDPPSNYDGATPQTSIWQNNGITRPSEAEYAARLQEAKQTGGWVDNWGRVWNPGSTVQGRGGHFEFVPQSQRTSYRDGDNLDQPIPQGPTQIEDIWTWIPDNPNAGYYPDEQALIGAGVYTPQDDKGSFMKGLQGMMIMGGPLLAGAGAAGGVVAGVAGAASSGYNTYQAAEAGDTTGAVISGVKGAVGAGMAANNAYNSYSGGNASADSGGYEMSEYYDPYGFDGGDTNNFGYDTTLDTDLGSSGYIDPAAGGGGDYGWIQDAAGNVKWGPLIQAGVGVAGALLANNAQQNSVNSAQNATNAASLAASNATLQGTRESIAAQQANLDRTRGDFATFLQPADRAMATLQSSIYGTPQEYNQRSLSDLGRTGAAGVTNPAAAASPYGGATAKDLMDMVIGLKPNPNKYTISDALKAAQAAKNPQVPMPGQQAIMPLESGMQRESGTGPQVANAQQFDLANFKPQETEAYNWQKSRGLDDLRTSLMMQGRPSGTVAANSTARFLGDLNAREYESGYNRMKDQKADYQNNLLNLVKIAQGAAGSTSAAGQNAANNTSQSLLTQGSNLSNIATNQGNNNANAALVGGQNQANLYQGLSQIPFQIASLKAQGGY